MLRKLIALFRKKLKGPPSEFKVGFDENTVWVESPVGERKSLSWSELIGVAIRTTDQGPFVDDVFWLLASKKDVIVYPSTAEGSKELLGKLQELRDFNNERVMEAMFCAENKTFIVWDHEGRQKQVGVGSIN